MHYTLVMHERGAHSPLHEWLWQQMVDTLAGLARPDLAGARIGLPPQATVAYARRPINRSHCLAPLPARRRQDAMSKSKRREIPAFRRP